MKRCGGVQHYDELKGRLSIGDTREEMGGYNIMMN